MSSDEDALQRAVLLHARASDPAFIHQHVVDDRLLCSRLT